ncbi:MAG: membrane protein insertase YidC [Clostridia bacterium]|nr:membrane protein insertase YidC [Clostridia bacterium]
MGIITQVLVPLIPEGNIPALYPIVGHVLQWVQGWTGNIGWTMIIFTLMLKMITLPFDIISRKSMKRNAIIQERLAPELEQLEKQCRGDQALYQQKMTARMRKEGYSMGGACLPSLITLVMFFFILAGLNQFATKNIGDIYNEMAAEYNRLTATSMSQTEIDEALIKQYDEISPNFLWIKNPWRPDSPLSRPIATAGEMFTSSGSNNTTGANGIKKLVYQDGKSAEEIEADYQKVMGAVIRKYNGENNKGANGFFILPVLAAAVSFLSQWLMMKMQPQQQSQAQENAMGGGMNKFMLIFFPIMMLFFSINYTAAFAVYIVFNSTFMMLANFAINYFVDKSIRKDFAKKDFEKSASYRREKGR